MRRRDLLRACGLGLCAGAGSVAGCVGDRRLATDGGGRLVLDRVATPSAAVRLNDLGTAPTGRAPTTASLSERRRSVVEAAADGTYRTEETPDWLVAFLADTRFVLLDGDYHRIDHDLPRYTVTAEAVAPERYMGRIADEETYREAMRHDGVIESGLVRAALEDGYTTVDPWPSLLSFLSEYEAVRVRDEVYALTLSVEDDGPPYEVTAERVPPTALADNVWDASDAAPAVREAVRAAGATAGVHAGEDLPEAFLAGVAEHQYVHLDGTFYWAGLERRGDVPASLSASVVESDLAQGARLRLELANDTDADLEVLTGAPPPFGVLGIRPADASDGGGEGESAGGPEGRLWTDAYRESDHVSTEGRQVTGVEDVGLSVTLPAGDSLTETYTLVDSPAPGAYLLRADLAVERPDGSDGTVPLRVHLRIE